MNDISNIKDWIQESPNANRKKLCEKFENDNEFAHDFAIEHPEYQDFVKHFIHESKWAFEWAWVIRDSRKFMKYKITEADDAFYWARYMGNQNFMKQIVDKSGEQNWIDKWNDEFKKNQI